ncbi:hypothetical protein [Xaviernesmea oryzae]|uniref:Uncharacterized protein n=1 Tax=Xaviernesmea oryzae TaxID=464029 RepID=A0A1X7DIN0_9HYPH|nr:hypothetical protein [Xaviernesmea oryzae]SMF16116.1 hypothetical protein SAMN02982989_5452 [Xaviernesmea oryzae]
MSGAFLALWNDYPSAMTEEYEAWHTFEHVPERLTAPGMLAARRYASFREPKNRYFTLYDLADLHTIDHPAYLDLVRNPTTWSTKMRRHFSNVLRIPARALAHGGRGIGRCSLVQAYSIGREGAESAGLRIADQLDAMVANGTLLGFRVGLAEPNQPYEVFVQNTRTDDDTYNVVIIVDGLCHQTLEEARPSIDDAVKDIMNPLELLRDDLFELVVVYPTRLAVADRASIAAGLKFQEKFGF